MTSWKKLGLIFNLQPISENIQTHASNPLAIRISEDVFRIYFSGRNSENKSSVGSVDFNMKSKAIVENSAKEVMKYGMPDSFYSHGISVGCSYQIANKEYILFMGWQIRDNNHWRGDVGRFELISKNENFKLNPLIPFIGTDDVFDKISLSYPCVLFEDGIYKMWYGSTIDWSSHNSEMIHVINYATSLDGENWTKHGLAVPYKTGVAQAFSRPCVIHDEKGYHMWFSYRSGDGTPYRIGYAKSMNGVEWKLALEEVGINVSDKGWDSEMICYPFVFDYEGERYMFYNGNKYGRDGFGLAILEK